MNDQEPRTTQPPASAQAESEELTAHPAAEFFPLLRGEAFDDLCQDVSERGLLEPIVLHNEQILDGRNRLRACRAVDVQPRFVDWKGEAGDPVSFVISRNLKRRHLSASQRAVLAVEALPEFEKAARERQRVAASRQGQAAGSSDEVVQRVAPGKSRDAAGELFRVNHTYVQLAKKLQRERPDLLAPVRRGEVSIREAARELPKAPRSRRRRNADPVKTVYDVVKRLLEKVDFARGQEGIRATSTRLLEEDVLPRVNALHDLLRSHLRGEDAAPTAAEQPTNPTNNPN